MVYNVTSEIMKVLWDSLNESPKNYNPYRVEKLFGEIADKGWACYSDVEDIFCLTDSRLDDRQIHISDLCNAFQIRTEDVFYKPSAKGTLHLGLSLSGVKMLHFF